MAEMSNRIEQFKKTVQADPDNELGHYSLGRAYLEAEQFQQAVDSLQRVVAINPKMSRAYQYMASAYTKLGQKDQALATLQTGLRNAQEQGDLLPAQEMTRMVQELGGVVAKAAPRPEKAGNASAGEVHCSRCHRVAPALAKPPFRGAQGQQIFEHVCADCWREWLGMGTKVINELQLSLNEPAAQAIYDANMLEFLGLK